MTEYVEVDEGGSAGPNGEDTHQPTQIGDGTEASATVKKPFRLSNGTLEYHERHEDAEGVVSYEWVSVCSDLRVVAMTKDVNGEEWGRLLLLTDPDGQEHEWAMPMAMLSADGNAYRERLLSMGLIMVPGRKTKDRLYIYIASQSPDARVRCVARTGWHNDVFVMPNETLGASSERIILQSSYRPDHAMRSAGSLAEWQEHIAQQCIGNSR
ncbi:MAG: DUF927 domain-containing protein, partial [Proteobacteria bacterium]|nr:DUF927 domain-containing protein [Pseudomonadota bacterium]